MLQILGKSTSINVRKVLWLCQELELPCELQQWGTGHRSTEAAEFRALNPNAMVPVIRDGSFVLWESNAICRYLACAYGRGGELLPANLQERAVVEQWMDWQATELNNSWRYAFMALVRGSAAHAEPGAIAAGVRNWNRHMTILEEQLRKTCAFVTGARFTLADIVLGLATHRWFMTPMQRPELPAVTDYYERLSQRPAFLAHGRNGVP
jgi:glutathione S-transferase